VIDQGYDFLLLGFVIQTLFSIVNNKLRKRHRINLHI